MSICWTNHRVNARMCLAVIGMEEIPQEEDGSEKLFDVLKTMFTVKCEELWDAGPEQKRAGDTTEGTDKKYRDQKGSPFVKRKRTA